MLTVDFERVGVTDRSRVLDMGCGGGRHAFEAWRRGATVVALDYSEGELKDVRGVLGAMLSAGEVPHGHPDASARGNAGIGGAVNGDALRLPFPDATFDAVIASEVLEHLWDDERAIGELVRVLKPGARMAITVPTRWPERVCWALDHRYHDVPGGHVRIYHQHELEQKLERAGCWLRGSHHAHALHSPYWWLKCATGIDRVDPHPLVRKYHDFLAWQITEHPQWVEVLDRALNPVLGKSLVIYVQKVSS
jgi:SAM-dependent methyltransferase